MAWIDIVDPERASGLLKRLYEAMVKRAGRVWNIVGIMSQNPRTMKTSMDFYRAVMFGDSPLSRKRREMVAVVVSQTNHCVY